MNRNALQRTGRVEGARLCRFRFDGRMPFGSRATARNQPRNVRRLPTFRTRQLTLLRVAGCQSMGRKGLCAKDRRQETRKENKSQRQRNKKRRRGVYKETLARPSSFFVHTDTFSRHQKQRGQRTSGACEESSRTQEEPP